MKAGVTLGVWLALLATSAHTSHRPPCLGDRATILGPNTHLRAQGHRAVIVGTAHRDVIVGSARSEWIVGAGGRDRICGGGGADYIFGGNWNRGGDQATGLIGGAGADHIDGGFAADRIVGGPGRDAIDGEFGADRIAGSDGDDFVRAQAGADHIRLGAGDDHVEASSGADVVRGGPGADNISTGAGEDIASGEGGNDSIHLLWRSDRGYGGPGSDGIHGGVGEDRCHGGPGADTATACERQRSIEGGAPVVVIRAEPAAAQAEVTRGHYGRKDATRPFERAAPVLHIQRFLRRLQRTEAITEAAATKRQIERKHVLGQRVARVVENRYEERLRHGSRVLAVFERSVERHRLKLILTAICDEIDRLRWTV